MFAPVAGQVGSRGPVIASDDRDGGHGGVRPWRPGRGAGARSARSSEHLQGRPVGRARRLGRALHVGQHQVLQAEPADRPGRVEDRRRRCARRACVCRSVWLAETTCWSAGSVAGSRRGPVSRWWVASSVSTSPSTRTSESTSTTRWSQTRSRSETTCEDSRTLSSVLGHRLHQHLQELPAGQRVEAGDRLVEDQQLRPLGQAEGEGELGALAAGQPAGPLAGSRPSRSIRDRATRVVPARVEVGAEPQVVARR